MGATSELFVFRHDRYVNCVTPVFRHLIQTAETSPWLCELWRLRQSRYSPKVRRLFGFSGHPTVVSDYVNLNGDLSCARHETSCVLLIGEDRGPLEDLQTLLEFAICRYCLGESHYLGNARRAPLVLEAVVEETGPAAASHYLRLHELCEELDRSAWIWTHSSGGFSEGVHGWLSPEQTKEFATALTGFDLPAPTLSWREIVEQVQGNAQRADVLNDAVHLARIREIAGVAAASGQGLLWGNDVCRDPDLPPPTIDPGWLHWNDGAVRRLARAIRDNTTFEHLPILADALEDAGCNVAEILTHCRQPGEHTWCCWVIDLLLEDECQNVS